MGLGCELFDEIRRRVTRPSAMAGFKHVTTRSRSLNRARQGSVGATGHLKLQVSAFSMQTDINPSSQTRYAIHKQFTKCKVQYGTENVCFYSLFKCHIVLFHNATACASVAAMQSSQWPFIEFKSLGKNRLNAIPVHPPDTKPFPKACST